jgi:hypothetical protein
MEEHRITKEYLESLSIGELTSMADTYNIDLPPELERIFIIEELLDFLSEDEDVEEDIETAPLQGEMRYLEPAPLPKQYNITFIETILRDPLWVFAYWEVKSSEREKYEKDSEFEGYELLVEPLNHHKAGSADARLKRLDSEDEDVFIILVGNDDHAWYLGFPPEGGRYRVKLCVLKGEERIILAVSRPFALPLLANNYKSNKGHAGVQLDPKEAEIYQNPLAMLSGVEDFHILRNKDRAARVKRYCDSQQAG